MFPLHHALPLPSNAYLSIDQTKHMVDSTTIATECNA
jgi:hypothetical protein